MDKITPKKIYLLVRLLKEKRERVEDEKQRHNLFIEARAYDKLLTQGIDDMITKLNTTEE